MDESAKGSVSEREEIIGLIMKLPRPKRLQALAYIKHLSAGSAFPDRSEQPAGDGRPIDPPLS